MRWRCDSLSLVFLVYLLAISVFLVSTSACSFSSKRKGASISKAAGEAKKSPDEQKTITPEEKRDVPLSEAAKAAEDKKKRKALTPDEDERAHEAHITTGVYGTHYVDDTESGTGEPVMVSPTPLPDTKPEGALHIGLVGGYGDLKGNDVDGYPMGGLKFGGVTGRIGGELRLLVAFPSLTDASGMAAGTENVEEMNVDALLRLYGTSEHTFVGVYGALGARIGLLRWDYKNPIEYDDGFGNLSTIYNDAIWSVAPLLGIGVAPVQAGYVYLGASLTGGYRLFKWSTMEGFDNDVFGSDFFLEFLVEVSAVIRP